MITEVLVPPLGTTVDVVTLAAWYKQEGDSVSKDSPLFAIETDKATLDVEAPAIRHPAPCGRPGGRRDPGPECDCAYC